MFKNIIVVLVLTLQMSVFAQNYKFGKVSKDELKEQFYPLDSTADAAYLYKYRRSFFNYVPNQGFQLVTEIHHRIKIYTSEGFDLTKPFIQDVLESGRAQFFEDTTDPETGDTIQQLAPFEQFTGPRLADFSSEQQEALTGLAALGRQGLATTPDLSSSAPYFQQAKQQAGLGSLAFTEADADRLMNPFLRGVTDTAKREAIRQYESTIQPKLDAAAVQAGSFGGSRAAILEAEAQRNLQNQLSEIEERGLATSYEQALKAFEAQKARELQGSALYSALGEAAPAQAARELAFLSTVGENKQAQDQHRTKKSKFFCYCTENKICFFCRKEITFCLSSIEKSFSKEFA